jgi:hypothetical protein
VPGFRSYLDKHKANVAVPPLLQKLASTPQWYQDTALSAEAVPVLAHALTRYLVDSKTSQGTEPWDPVFRFHLRCGAQALHRVNLAGSTSSLNLDKSFGVLVNYLYHGDAVDEAQRLNGVPVSPSVAELHRHIPGE